ncbi:putative bifunctional diguanylate cyclase/phosphodiesterase [Deinococcus apachensis]|uniref:putative bifunctional diguanylate cyclase/phosphodiesterase n=1 Tax=Deinococcus apachensis TaxID=309886 RepID=UPI0003817036|nr:EAL domain-containing protein [Deinococcus apachensis]
MLTEVQRQLDRLGLSADSPPSVEEWRAFLAALDTSSPPTETLASWHHQAVENSPGPLFVMNREGRVRGGNLAFLTLFGRGSPGRHYESLCPPAEAARLTELITRVFEGEVLEGISVEFHLPDGTPRFMLAHLYPSRGGDGRIDGCILACTDVTERHRKAEALEERYRSYETILNAVPAPLAVFDRQQRYLFCNPSAIANDEIRAWVIGRDDFEYCAHRGFSPTLAQKRREQFEAAVRQRGPIFWEEHFTLPDGSVRHMLRCLNPVFSAGGELDLAIGYGLDITDRKQALEELAGLNRELETVNRRLRHDALHDALTGLPNRTLLRDRLEQALTRVRETTGPSFAVLFLDTDRFKMINDSLGHPAGDALLVALAGRLQAELRPTDTVSRLGGDEFTLLLEPLEEASYAREVAERIGAALRQPFVVQGHELLVSASIGLVLGDPGYESATAVLRDADIAMYRAKARGGAGYQEFTPEMRERAVGRISLERDLRRAVRQRELRVLYQPIVALNSRRMVGFEALVRWQHPVQGLLPPSAFIELAEETGLILDLDRWVLREACAQMLAWRRPGEVPLGLCVNFSGRHFAAPDVYSSLAQVLDELGFEPRALKLELTEGVLLQHSQTIGETLARIRELGVGLSIDDFGTGYSSLGYLQSYPVDTLKIDRSFINRMLGSEESAELVRTIITMAKNLRLRVVAEGIEFPAQLERLRALGCDYVQGYLLSRPLSAADVPAYLNRERAARPGELLQPG